MKVLNKDEVIRRKDVTHTMTERRALQNIRHPYIVQLHFAFQTGNKLFLVRQQQHTRAPAVAGGRARAHTAACPATVVGRRTHTYFEVLL